MAINKFVDRQGNTLLDLSVDTVSSNRVLAGTTYHGPDGLQHTGTLDPGPLDYSQYNFMDYDGTLLYSYTDEELDALEELPAGPDHTDDNLTFQEWNWSLADLKAWDRTRPDRPLVGANLITTDGKSYLYLDTPYAGATLSFSKSSGAKINSVDWGDGTIDTNTSHIYANPGQYVIVIDMTNGDWFFGYGGSSTSTNRQWITNIKLGNISALYNGHFASCHSLKTISLPRLVSVTANQSFEKCYDLKYVSMPKNIATMGDYTFWDCYSLQYVSIPKIFKAGGRTFNNTGIQYVSFANMAEVRTASIFNNCPNLKNFVIPNDLTTIESEAFSNCMSLNILEIPDNITNISGGYNFSNDYSIILDLSKQTKVITLSTASIGIDASRNKILVPNALLEDYKTAPYWSDYASIMVGV